MCDVCHGYHPTEEMEVVTIQVIKSKSCDLNSRPPQIVATPIVPLPTATELVAPPPAVRRPVVPPQFAGMMIKPGDPGFEERGAKETRHV